MKKLLSILILILFTTTVKAQLELPYPVKVVNPRSLDYKYLYQGNRPYTDTAEVNATIPLGIRHKGLIVNVNNTLWWYKDSVLNNSLVQIQLGGGISKTYADWGLSNVNDSTLKVDSSVLLTKLKGLNLIDSFRTSINATTPIIYTPSTSNIYLPKGSADSSGYISSTDWAAFDNKLNQSDTASMLSAYLRKADTTDKWIAKTHTVNNISNGTGFLKNNGSGTWSWDGNSYVDLSSNQTVSGNKTFNDSKTTIKVDGLGLTQDYTKGLRLENTTGATTNSPQKSPALILAAKNFGNDAGSGGWLSRTIEWMFENKGNQGGVDFGSLAAADPRLVVSYRIQGQENFTTVAEFGKNGIMANIINDVISLGSAGGSNGRVNFHRSSDGSLQGWIASGNSGDVAHYGNTIFYNTSIKHQPSGGFYKNFAYYGTHLNSTTAIVSPSAILHLGAGLSSAGGSPLKFTLAGAALLTTPERGALEAMPYRLSYTDSSNKRNTLAYVSDVAAKQDTITGAATTITTSNLTANRALLSDANGKVAVSSVTSTELGYVGGVTSSIQTQLNAKLTTANSNVKRYIRVDSTTYSGNYAMDGTKEVILINYAEPCGVTLPVVSGLPDGSVFEIQFYNWGATGKTIDIYSEGGNSEEIDAGLGIANPRPKITFRSDNQANTVTPLSLRIMWLASDNVWTVLQGGVLFDY